MISPCSAFDLVFFAINFNLVQASLLCIVVSLVEYEYTHMGYLLVIP